MHRFDRRFLLKVSLASLLGASLAHAQQDLRGALRRGGQVIYFRHGATTWSGVDRIEWPRARQRLLSDLGI
ncbi:MAG: histidine phosphatase family protein, partial [Pseudomonadota bacterium]